VKEPREEEKSISCRLINLPTGAVYEQKDDEMFSSGLYVDLGG